MDATANWTLYSWKDAERRCMALQSVWADSIGAIEVYPSEITVYPKSSGQPIDWTKFQEIFGERFDLEEKSVRLDMEGVSLPVVEEEERDIFPKPLRPLFREILYRKSSYPDRELPPLPHPVIAFHSYKGGVGRTLSLLAFVKAWSGQFSDDDLEERRLLIVDADIEAPGLSWLQENGREDDTDWVSRQATPDSYWKRNTLSYLDLLTLIQDNADADAIADLAASQFEEVPMLFETSSQNVEHLFIPTYRYREQLLDLYASPESVANGINKQYILSEVLSKLCDRLGLYGAAVDLRAGLSEFSSTLLFDPRVKKYLVTSPSFQSVQGTQILLHYILRGLPNGSDIPLPQTLLNMVQEDTPSQDEKAKIINKFLGFYETDEDTGDRAAYTAVTELPFASELVYSSSLEQILKNLEDRTLYQRMKALVSRNYGNPAKAEIAGDERRRILDGLKEEKAIEVAGLVNTQSLQDLNRHRNIAPCIVVTGTRGAGKTFLYRKMAEAGNWEAFRLSARAAANKRAVASSFDSNWMFLPVLAAEKLPPDIFQTLFLNLREQIPAVETDQRILTDNRKKLAELAQAGGVDWDKEWESLLARSISPKFETLQEAGEALKESGKTVLFLLDGFDEFFPSMTENEESRKAIKSLFGNVAQKVAEVPRLKMVAFIHECSFENIILLPSDSKWCGQPFMASEEPSEKIYLIREVLRWTPDEAFRLAAQILGEVSEKPGNANAASTDVIERKLLPLWGEQLGKPLSNEPPSAQWIQTKLTDLNGQLRPKDMLRFLAKAADASSDANSGCLLKPDAIRRAVKAVGAERLKEIQREPLLKSACEKLNALEENRRSIPICVAKPTDAEADAVKLTDAEADAMSREGLLAKMDGGYCLSELLRQALGFSYKKGARLNAMNLTRKRRT